jgi:hypothetical protein
MSDMMNRWMLYFSLFLFAVVIVGALCSVFQRQWLFLRKTDDAKQAYIVLAVTAVALFTWAYFGDKLEVKSVAIAGVTADVNILKHRVETFSEQMETFLNGKKIEVFDKTNWSQRIRKIGRAKGSFLLEVTLEQEPIPSTVEIFEGVLMMPEQDYHFEGKVVRFPSNQGKPTVDITIKYYPRVVPK